MAAFRRRPSRSIWALAIASAALAGCSLVRPVELPGTGGNVDAAALAQRGRHAQAAEAYATLASSHPGERDYYELKSAQQWLASGNAGAAQQALAGVSPAANVRFPMLRALVGASVGVANRNGESALRDLARIRPPGAPGDAAEYWGLRGQADFLVGDVTAGVRAYVERERWLPDPAAVRANRDQLFAQIRAAAARGASFASPPGTGPVVAGWLALAPVARDFDRNPMSVTAALAAWRAHFPDHPADATVTAAEQQELRAVTRFPRRIALLLPLSGPAGDAGVAVRDGFLAAYFQQAAASRPRVRIYNVASQPIATVYSQALADGADFIVGPLTKQDVAAIAPLSTGRVPILALNFLANSVAAPRDFYQFALRPEDEARIVAQRLVADGRLHGVAIVPQGEWGERVTDAFRSELDRHGGGVLAVGRYAPGQINFSDIIRATLEIGATPGEPSAHRADATFVFVAGPPGITRLVMPQLKFNYAGDIPVYSMPDGYAPGPVANADIDGMRFPDMPWMISADPVTAKVRASVDAAWPNRSARWGRLYAFGFDAYRLVPALRSGYLAGGTELAGMTGQLRLDDLGRIRRGLDWAVIRDGVPNPL